MQPEDVGDQRSRLHRWRQQFRRFAETTQFHGFVHLAQSQSWPELFIWLALIFACLGLTIKDVVQSMSEFSQGTTISTTTVVQNSTISFPNASICIELTSWKFDFGIELENYSSVKQFLDDSSELAYQAGFLPEYKKHINYVPKLLNSFETLDPQEEQELKRLVFLTTTMLMNIVRLENTVYENASIPYGAIQWGVVQPVADNLSLPDNTTGQSIAEVHRFYSEYSVDFRHLIRTSAYWLCRFMRPFVARPERTTPTNGPTENHFDLCSGDLLWLGLFPFNGGFYDVLCLRFDPSVFQFRSEGSTLIIHVQPDLLYQKTTRKRRLALDDLLMKPKVIIDLESSGTSFSFCRSCQAFEQKQSAFALAIEGHYRAHARAGGSCENGGVYADCRGLCRAKLIQQACDCWPLSWSLHFSPQLNVSLCGTTAWDRKSASSSLPDLGSARCLQAIATSWGADQQCADMCKRSCDTLIIAFEREDFPDYFRVPVPHGNFMIFSVSRYTYPLVVESLKVDFPTLLSNLGGNLGLWIGGSILAVVHLLLYPLRLYVCRKAEIVEDENPTSTELNGNRYGGEYLDWNSHQETTECRDNLQKTLISLQSRIATLERKLARNEEQNAQTYI